MPFRNAAATLPATLASIARQTFDNFELIAVDDHSSDESACLLERFDEQRRLIANEGRGIVAALNSGLEAARAPLIARMDADDVMEPRRLELQYAALAAEGDLALVGSRVALFSDGEILAGYQEYVRWQNQVLSAEEISAQIYVESPLSHPSVMFRRDAILAAGGYREGDFPEDYELWLRLHHAGHRMRKVPEVLLQWRESATRTSRVDPRYSRAAFDELRARYLALDRRLQGREIVVWGAGRKTRLRVRRLLQRGVRVAAFIDIDPRKIGRTIDGVAVRPREWLDGRASFVLVYVTNHGARDEISAFLEAIGYRIGVDYLPVG